MMFGTVIVPLVLQSTTHFVRTRAVESVCQNSTIVLSISSAAITVADGSVSISYSIFPVNKHVWQTTGRSTTILQSSAEPTDPLSEFQTPNVATYHQSTSSAFFLGSGYPLSSSPRNTDSSSVLSSFSGPLGSLISSTTQLSTPPSFTDSIFPSLAGFDSSTKVPADSIFISLSITSSSSKQTVMPTSSTSPVTPPMNPSYTCPRDNGMYYSDASMRVYQVLCNTDEPDSNLGTTSQPQLQSCVDSCGNVTGCIGVSYTATSGSCSYKSSVSNRVGSSTADSAILADYICPGADSTRLVDSSGSVYEILCNTFFPLSSNITSDLTTSDLASCSRMCSDTNDCTGFTFQNGSCTLVSNRNSGNGVLRMNVATAILMAKRVAQVVSSGIAPYKSTSLVRSLPADVSRTPSSTFRTSPATSITPTSTISMTDETSTVGISSMALSSPSASFEVSLTVGSTTIDLANGIITEPTDSEVTMITRTSCSAGGNAINICVDAAITPSIGLGGNAGVGVGVGSSTITLVDVSASLAIAPSVTAGVDLGLSIDSSGIGLVASATIGAKLNLSPSVNATIGPLLPNTVSAAASAGLNLNFGSSSSALTLVRHQLRPQ